MCEGKKNRNVQGQQKVTESEAFIYHVGIKNAQCVNYSSISLVLKK